jgi:hypothetical protein
MVFSQPLEDVGVPVHGGVVIGAERTGDVEE